MRRLNKLSALVPIVFLAGILAAAPLCAQSSGAPADTEGLARFSTDTRIVPLYLSVVDRKGNLVTDLPEDAFTVYENDVEQTITHFGREDVPVSMGLIIDSSGSMQDKRRQVESAALVLVQQSNSNDEVFIVNFNDEAYLDTPFTNNMSKMEEGLTQINSRGGTAMRDALSMSIDYALEEGERDKKVLLVVTDGNDNTSGTTLEKLVNKAQNSEVLIYAVGLLNQEARRERKRAERALDALTEASGGLAYYPKEASEVEAISVQVAHEIRNQYVIEYSPSNQDMDGTYRRIRVEVKGPNKPQARTRTGYYATDEIDDTGNDPVETSSVN